MPGKHGGMATPRRSAGLARPDYWPRAILAGLAIVLVSSGPVQSAEPASRFSTRQLLTACAAGPGASDRGTDFCDGFIVGAGLFYLELRRAEKIPAWACPEPVPDLPEIRRAFIAWAEANPERLGEPAIDGFWRAMAETYPCAAQ